jgi:uncharacterized circularly permuted ATP-grasp superfamily protein
MPDGETAPVLWESYTVNGTYDELLAPDGSPRPAARAAHQLLGSLTLEDLRQRQEAADLDIRAMGITFPLHEDPSGLDRAWPYDVIPRVIPAEEWDEIERGLVQRLRALNRFITDVYGDQEILAAGKVPKALVLDSPNFREACVGVTPPLGVWAHIAGIDLVRGADGTVFVLEDNLRVPSGVSYMLENRLVTKRVFADLFRDYSIQPVDGYVTRLLDLLRSVAPERDRDGPPCCVLLTPGVYNSAYFEHSYLAQEMGIPLVEGGDLYVGDDDAVYLRTIDEPQRVDVVYRRVDDLYLDPEVYEPTSVVGVPGIIRAWQAGNVAIVNAPGAGVADDKVVYTYVHEMIRFYLDEEPLLATVPTYWCGEPDQRAYVLDHVDELVVKPATEAGGYGITVGPKASAEQLSACCESIRADPAGFVAQPMISLSTVPTLCDDRVAPRHVDLRPFVLTGSETYVSRGGLTRVALREGSLIVNSSQGGGSKDTWIVEADPAR